MFNKLPFNNSQESQVKERLPLNTKAFEFHPEIYYQNNITETIPKFLLNGLGTKDGNRT